jgi:hypothetical protein
MNFIKRGNEKEDEKKNQTIKFRWREFELNKKEMRPSKRIGKPILNSTVGSVNLFFFYYFQRLEEKS